MRNLNNSKLIVIKIGTNVLTKKDNIDSEYLRNIAEQISSLVNSGKKCIIVTSGAIGFGSMRLGQKGKSRDIKMRQALAAIGQHILMNEYARAFSKHGISVAQILLTYDVISERKTNLNLKNSIDTLLSLDVIPVINENDVVSIDEIGTRFGDNDRLSAMVASKMDAQLLILLTDIDGLYTKNPKKYKDAKKIDSIDCITPEIEKCAGASGSAFGTGGMQTKIEAAKIALDAGCSVIIANGREDDVIRKIMQGEEIGTLFISHDKLPSKKRWIFNARPKGRITINPKAEEVLREGKSSLLPVGILKVDGNFKAGDIVEINDFAKAVVDFSSKEIDAIKGLRSSEACLRLGKKENCRDEVIKKENIVFV